MSSTTPLESRPATPLRDITAGNRQTVAAYVESGMPYVWITAAAISVAFVIVVALLFLTAARGLPHFWPADVIHATYVEPGKEPQPVLAEIVDREQVTRARLLNAGVKLEDDALLHERLLIKRGNRDVYGSDFTFVLAKWLQDLRMPVEATVFERLEWGNFYGTIAAVKQGGTVVATGDQAWAAYLPLQARADELRERIEDLERGDIGQINYALERLRLDTRRLELAGRTPQNDAAAYAELDAKRKTLDAEYEKLRADLNVLKQEIARDALTVKTAEGTEVELPLSKIVRGYQPNAMSLGQKVWLYGAKLHEFVFDAPREANTEGGIFPAIFGTVLMVLLMSVFVTPFGILAALYLREYARQGPMTQAIRIAVNNLAGVPSIVYGMFGLGFFVYFVGGSLDRALYPEALPAPTFGTPGILWSSLTLAILTLPVVIVATEEGLARIPRSLREASLALGATKAETLWRVVLPMASPAMMTGLILAIARAAGEVAPLMLVGVVKLAPSLPLDASAPFLHLERKFMHLGFHIYDVGFQSPNVEAARPLVYATAFLLVLVILSLNLTAIRIRNRLRERYKALDA
jgi:phosphate transport system permease protein